MPIKRTYSSKLGRSRYFRSRSTKSQLTKLVRCSNWCGERISSWLGKFAPAQAVLLILLVGEEWFSQFVLADGSIDSSLSTDSQVTSFSNVINAWSGTNTWECSWFEVVEVVEMFSPLESNIDPPLSGSIKDSQVELKSYCFPTEYCFNQVRALLSEDEEYCSSD